MLHFRSFITFSSFILLTAALMSCSRPLTTQTPDPSGAGTFQTLAISYAGKYSHVHTLTIPSTVSRSSLQTMYGGKILGFNPELGTAIIANNVGSRQKYDLTVEVNATNFKFGDVKTLGYSAWSTGYSAWSTGYSAWSTGTSSAANTFSENLSSWNAIHLSDAQTLVPELGRGIQGYRKVRRLRR